MNRAIVSIAGWLRRKPMLGRLALKCLPDIEKTISIPTIGPFRIRLRRNRSFWLRDPLSLELVMYGFMKRLVRPGDVCFDVGSNIGLYARSLVAGFKAGQVVAFEPMRENIELLRQNIALDPAAASKIRLIEAALSDSDGEELLQVDDMMTSSATLDRVTGGKPAQGREQYGLEAKTEKVRVAKLDTLMEREGLPIPNFIKVDIEGAEYMMLKGATATLERHGPVLAIEMHRLDVTRQVLELLSGLGYHVFCEIPDEGRRVWREITARDVEGRSDPYDIHQVVAAKDASLVREKIEEFAGF